MDHTHTDSLHELCELLDQTNITNLLRLLRSLHDLEIGGIEIGLDVYPVQHEADFRSLHYGSLTLMALYQPTNTPWQIFYRRSTPVTVVLRNDSPWQVVTGSTTHIISPPSQA